MKTFKKSKMEQMDHNMMNTEHDKVSQGAEFIGKVITSSHGNQWRRKNAKKQGHKHGGKHGK